MTDLLDAWPHFLFLYGTLKPGHGNHHVITAHGGIDIGPAKTVGRFLLNDGFPYVWHVVGPRSLPYAGLYGRIVGHLYKVSKAGLEACDRLEGHPRHYVRTNVPVTWGPDATPPQQIVTAGIYLAPGQPQGHDLQKPIGGLLEWGRAEPEVAREFQRVKKRR